MKATLIKRGNEIIADYKDRGVISNITLATKGNDKRCESVCPSRPIANMVYDIVCGEIGEELDNIQRSVLREDVVNELLYKLPAER